MPNDLAVVKVSYSLAETGVIVSVLRAYGIYAVPLPGEAASNLWFYLVAFGGIEIRVPAFQAGDALQVLEGLEPVEEAKMSAAFMRRPIRLTILVLLLFLVTGIALPAWLPGREGRPHDPPLRS